LDNTAGFSDFGSTTTADTTPTTIIFGQVSFI
jgi:hypothetical protein